MTIEINYDNGCMTIDMEQFINICNQQKFKGLANVLKLDYKNGRRSAEIIHDYLMGIVAELKENRERLNENMQKRKSRKSIN